MPHDYLKEFDIAPPAALGGPINNPLDTRALHYFGFTSEAQEIILVNPIPANARVLVSWQFANQPTPALPPPPPVIHAVLDFAAGLPVVRYEGFHERAHAVIWLDPAAAVAGPLIVRLRAWSR